MEKLTPKDIEDVVTEEQFLKVLAYLREIKYGTVTLIIQDGKVVQVDKLEKIRFK
ncbi:MAG: YezD family protein [Oscillospiraceae bacterium]|jgi:hypothetical protein|nr:YezD family protein [Oscillospiraceae bacterium]